MKKIKVLLIVLMLILGGAFFSKSYAAERTLGADLKRPFTDSKYQYRVAGLVGDEELTDILYTIVKIYDNADKDANAKLLYSKALYCLRGGLGFGADDTSDVATSPITYSELGEMHKDAKSIIEKYKEYYNGVNLDRAETINEKEINIYNAILWILDESYLPVNKEKYNEEEYKVELLNKAGISKNEEQRKAITKDDIEVVQQLAIWYFTNYDEQMAEKKPTVSQASITPAAKLIINDEEDFDGYRRSNLNKLYQYFINGAIDNASSYSINEETRERTKVIEENKFDKTLETRITEKVFENLNPNLANDEYYQIGPFNIDNGLNSVGNMKVDSTNIVLYDAEGKVIGHYYEFLEGKVVQVVEFINKADIEKSEAETVTNLEKGIDYYIRINKTFVKDSGLNGVMPNEERYDLTALRITLTSPYTLSTATVLIREETDQPVVEIDKEKITIGDEIIIEPPKEFDLSLRKFITSIKRGDADIKNDSRVPEIDTSTLINGIENRDGTTENTATYTHPKNPLSVEIGDKVIYTIRVYNEGEIDGTATSVTDYLPEGLKIIPSTQSNINATYGWTNPSNDGKTIVTDYLKDKTIKAFDESKTTEEAGWQKATTGNGGLYYADLQIECEVIASVTGEAQNLRNIAAITEDTGDDRDSDPGDPGREDYNPPADNSTYKEDDDDYEDLVLPGKEFDLALRKYITNVERNGQNVSIPNERSLNNIDITKLISGEEKTAEYKHRKDPVEVQANDIITYTFKAYNEGTIDGEVSSIIDYLPEGLEFVADLNTNFIEYIENHTYTSQELEGKEYAYKIDGNRISILPISSVKDYETGIIRLFDLKAFDGTTLDSKSIDVKLKVTVPDSNKDKILTNIATMTYRPINANVADRDSAQDNFTVPTAEDLIKDLPGYKGNEDNKNVLTDSEYHYAGIEDDDDFEKIIIKGKEFDLALRKYVAAINGVEAEISRVPQIDTSKLNTIDENTGKEITTATYTHSKEPLTVKKGDIVTYKIRIYNEGKRDGYATKVTDYLPEGLGFLYTATGDINSEWFLSEGLDTNPLYGTDGIYESENTILKKDAYSTVFGENVDLSTIQVVQGSKNENGTRNMIPITAGGTIGETQIKATDLIKAYGSEVTDEDLWQQSTNSQTDGLFYQELEITCIVLKENTYQGILKNVAEITAAEDSEGNQIINVGDDRDSEPNNVYEDQNHTPAAKVDGYTPGEQDDDDFEPLQLKYFDLALRKFITGVETNGKTEDVTSRIPVLKIGEDGNIVYEHSKEPVYVATNDVVTYTIRVFNEGTIAGYAEEITDDIPEGLEYLPEHDTNKQYNWVMIDKDGNVTENVEEAVKITTDYLSEGKNKEENLLAPFDSSKAITTEQPLNPDYKDVKVAFKVGEPNTSDRIIINSAQISEDSDDDEDSIPNEWNEDEDDQDKEYIYVKYFDLSLLKWVTKTIVTVDGKTTTTETGFKPNTGKTETTGIRDNTQSEPIAKVELDRKKLDKTTVKFAYKIRVTNEGEIAGYATEITDFIPEGLEFKEEDNKAYGWVKEGENKVTTRALETKLLNPGESAELEIIFSWKKDKNNLGLKTNIAEITEDYNENNSEDIDSVPDNKIDPYEKEQEDDDDFALVILSIKTGKGTSYILFVTAMLTLLASGMYLVKKYVLTY